MKISIITVCHNAEDSIESTMLSIFEQTCQEIEYIIIDGNSSDSTLEIIEKYRNKVDKLISEPDSGIYNAMNKGIDAATGDYLIFLNAGDRFHSPDALEKVFGYISKHNKDIFFADVNLISKKGSSRVNSFTLSTEGFPPISQ